MPKLIRGETDFQYPPDVVVEYVMVKGDKGDPGATGPTGAQGPPGADAVTGLRLIEVNFAAPLDVWQYSHGLNTDAIVVIMLNLDRTVKDGEESFVDKNTVRVDWYFPESGILQIYY